MLVSLVQQVMDIVLHFVESIKSKGLDDSN